MESKKVSEGVTLTREQSIFLLPHFLLLIVGKPGSGKSYLTRQLFTSEKFYARKFDYVVVVSPSVQKLGIPVKKEFKNTKYDLTWLTFVIGKINEHQVKKFQQLIRSHTASKGQQPIPHLPQAILDASLGSEAKQGGPSLLPAEYVTFNKQQRFFSMEILAIMNQGMPKIQYKPGQAGKGKKEGLVTDSTKRYGDVDDIEKDLVAKLSVEEREQTKVNMVLILDDVIGDIKANENNPIQQQLIFNRRHLIANGCISIVLLSQKYMRIPTSIRSNANWMVLFRLNPKDFQNVYDDVIMFPHQKWDAIIKQVFQLERDTDDYAKMKEKKYFHLDIWVEFDVLFENFQRLKLGQQQQQQ